MPASTLRTCLPPTCTHVYVYMGMHTNIHMKTKGWKQRITLHKHWGILEALQPDLESQFLCGYWDLSSNPSIHIKTGQCNVNLGAKTSWSLELTSGKLQVQWDHLFQKLRWRVIEVDTRHAWANISSMYVHTCTHVHICTRARTHTYETLQARRYWILSLWPTWLGPSSI